MKSRLSMNPPSEGVCNHIRAEEQCDCCSNKPTIVGGSSRRATGDDLSTGWGVTDRPNAEEGGQSAEDISILGTASLSYSQLDADTRKSVSSWLRYVDHSDWETDLSHGTLTSYTPKYYAISSDDEEVHEDGGLETESSDVSAREKRFPDQDSPEERRRQQIPSLVSFFRLASDSTSSTSSSDCSDYGCSPRTIADARRTDPPLWSVHNDFLHSQCAERRSLAGAGPIRMSRRMFSDKETPKATRRPAKRPAPLARLLLTFSRACAETSVRLDRLVGSLTQSGRENHLKIQRDRSVETGLNTDCSPMQQWSAFTAHQMATKGSDAQSKSGMPATEGGSSEERFYARASADSIKRFRGPPTYCSETVAETLLHCICFERKRPSRGLFQAIAGSGGQILASATALAARAAAAAAAAVDDSDSETEYGAASFDVPDGDIAEEEERFVFTFAATPFQFVLWASRGSQSLLKSPLLPAPQVMLSARPALKADDLEGNDDSCSELHRKKHQLFCLRAIALRLLLLICHGIPDWYAKPPEGDVDQTTATTVSALDTKSPDVDVEEKGRRKFLPHTASHCSYVRAREDGATGTVPEKGIFGYMVRKDVDLLWQRWKRVTTAGRKSAQDKDALEVCDHKAAQRDTPTYSRHDYENEITIGQPPHQSGDDFIWRAARCMLEVDPQLLRLWAVKVPNFVSDEEFWKQYFYQVFHVMKRCERQVEPQWPFLTEADT